MLVFDAPEYRDRLEGFMDLWRADPESLLTGRKLQRMALSDLLTAKTKLRYFDSIRKSREKMSCCGKKTLSYFPKNSMENSR